MTDQTEAAIRAVTDQLVQHGLDGTERETLLRGYCEDLAKHGLPLLRMHVAQRALHPEIGGLGFIWWREGQVVDERYSRATPIPRWLASPLYHMIEHRLPSYRHRLCDEPSDFPFLTELRDLGATDYYARMLPFEHIPDDVRIDPTTPPEGAQLSFATDRPGGFTPAHLALIDRTVPTLGVVLKTAAHRRMAYDLMSIYLGRDAGLRVISGEIQRGSSRQITAVIMVFDLEDFTSLSERIAGPDLVAMLNDYFGVVVAAVERAGGNVLKFMGDGLLAMFDAGSETEEADAALAAAEDLMVRMAAKSTERAARGLPATSYTLALHAGDLLYGNIGGEARLDFTVIGPSVNLAARLSGMHRNIGRRVIVSDQVRNAARQRRDGLVSLGRYMLRGVAEPMELFTIHRDEPD